MLVMPMGQPHPMNEIKQQVAFKIKTLKIIDLLLLTSDFQLLTSDFQLLTSDFQLLTLTPHHFGQLLTQAAADSYSHTP